MNESHKFNAHPWHAIPIGTEAPLHIRSFIEIQKNSKTKYEVDKETGLLHLDRILDTDFTYPFHYGFIPQTYAPDNDPLDVVILASEQLLAGSTVDTTVIGGINMVDGGEQDDKIIAIATFDPQLKHIKTLEDIDKKVRDTMLFFFKEYKKKEHKTVMINGFLSKDHACIVIQESIDRYNKLFSHPITV